MSNIIKHMTIANLIGLCRLYNIPLLAISNIKSHKFNSLQCDNCNIHMNDIRKYLNNYMDFNSQREEILSCNEIVIKNLLE